MSRPARRPSQPPFAPSSQPAQKVIVNYAQLTDRQTEAQRGQVVAERPREARSGAGLTPRVSGRGCTRPLSTPSCDLPEGERLSSKHLAIRSYHSGPLLLIFWKVLKVLLSVPSAEPVKNLLGAAKAVSPAKPVSAWSLEEKPGGKTMGREDPGWEGSPQSAPGDPQSGSGSTTDPLSLRGYSPCLTFQICEMESLISTLLGSCETMKQ